VSKSIFEQNGFKYKPIEMRNAAVFTKAINGGRTRNTKKKTRKTRRVRKVRKTRKVKKTRRTRK
jgi:hypothetical protein